MTNISDDRKVILAPIREVPYETTFLLSDAKQDPSIKNRYWFDLPSQWANQANKDPIIGIRDIYFTKCYRYLVYQYEISLYRYSTTTQTEPDMDNNNKRIWLATTTGTIFSWVDGGLTLKETCIDFSRKWIEPNINQTQHFEFNENAGNSLESNVSEANTARGHNWISREVNSWIEFNETDKQTYICFGRHEGDETFVEYTGKDNNTYYYRYQIMIKPINDEAKMIFNRDTYRCLYDRVKFPVNWSRYQCLVKSSIANNDKNNIIGHTRNDPYIPIKYYRLNHDVKKFWIELYETRSHNIPVSIPTDKKDDLIIEAVVCFSSSGMI